MSTEGLAVSVLVVLAFAVWVALPFVQRVPGSRRGAANSGDNNIVARQRERLQIYYQRVLRNVHDLDEDNATGKLNPDEYTVERARWVQRGVEALRTLETLDAQHLVAPAQADAAAIDEAIDRAIETAVSGHRQQSSPDREPGEIARA